MKRSSAMATFLALVVGLLLLGGQVVFSQDQEENQDSTGGTVLQVDQHEALTDYLTDSEGMTVYLFTNDQKEGDPESTCYDQCAVNWPPVEAGMGLEAGEGVNPELLTTIERDDGTMQAVYNGWPLYYFIRDEEPGDINGHGVNDVWFAISSTGGQAGSEADEMESEPEEPEESEDGEQNQDGEQGEGSEQSEGSEQNQDGEQSEDGEQGAAEGQASDAGFFAASQVDSGLEVYEQHCAICHGYTLLSGEMGGPPLTGSYFFNRWGDRTVGELFEYIHTYMPLGQGGTLTTRQYSDVTAYILDYNDFPAGEVALEPDSEVLDQVITAPQGE